MAATTSRYDHPGGSRSPDIDIQPAGWGLPLGRRRPGFASEEKGRHRLHSAQCLALFGPCLDKAEMLYQRERRRVGTDDVGDLSPMPLKPQATIAWNASRP